MRTADLDTVAGRGHVDRKELGAFRLEVELAHLGHDADAARAIHRRTGIDSREGLASADPWTLGRALGSKDAGWRANAAALELIHAAAGKDLTAFRHQPPERVTRAVKRLAVRVARNNPTAEIVDVEQLRQPLVKYEAIMRARQLLREAGVADLSSLGSFPVRGRRRIEPGFHLGLSGAAGAGQAASPEVIDQLTHHGRRNFQHVEVREDSMRFREDRPIQRAVILAPALEFLAGGELVIAKEVSHLTIIADEILYGDVLQITYEDGDEAPDQPTVLPQAAHGDPTMKATLPYPIRSAEKIRELLESEALAEIWEPHRIYFDLDPRVDDVVVPADVAVNWPESQTNAEDNAILKAKDADGNFLHFDPDAVNFYFVHNIDESDKGHVFAFVNVIGKLDKKKPGSYVIIADSVQGMKTDARVAAHDGPASRLQ